MGKVAASIDADREDQRMAIPEHKTAQAALATVAPKPVQNAFRKILVSLSIETHTALRVRAAREGKTMETVARAILDEGVAEN